MAIKKSQTTSISKAKTAKSSAGKNITSTKTKTPKKSGVKRPVKAVKAYGTTLSRPKTVAKPAVKTKATKSGAEIKKLIKPNEVKKTKETLIETKKSDKTYVAKTKGKKASPQKPLTTAGLSKSEIRGKKPLKKSPVKIVKAISKITQKKNVKPDSAKKPSARKVGKVVARKAGEKTDQKILAPVKAVIAAKKEKKSTVKTVKPELQKKSAISSKIPQIKETIKQKTVLKPKERTESAISSKTIKRNVVSSAISGRPLTNILEGTASLHTAAPQAETKPKKATRFKVFLPEEELPPEESQHKPSSHLPEEYGDNELLLMEVDPSVVFVSWEIKPEDISSEAGKLALRVYDVTGIDFDGTNANMFFDISLNKRADSKFLDIKMQGRDIIMEIGLLRTDGTFKAIKQSGRVSMPALQAFDELDIAGLSSDSETLMGY